MGLLSLQFLLLVSIVIILYRVVPWQPGRVAVLTAANVVFVASFASFADGPAALLPFAAYLLQGWICIQALRVYQSRLALGVAVGWMVCVFIVLKQYSFIQPLLEPAHVYVTLGFSYVLFRVLHLMIDTATGEKIEGLSPLRYFNYTCMFLSFVSGPIQRYEDYAREETRRDQPRLDGPQFFAVLTRVIIGLIKLVFLAPAATTVLEGCLRSMAGAGGLASGVPEFVQLATANLAFVLFLYWNFSGSMDVVIGAGRAMGFTLPENFNRPLGAPNLIDFWTRWHMTLSNWFRVYLFNPTVTFLTRLHTNVRLAPYYGVIGFFVTFFVMGAWHGTTAVIILHGLILGAGVSLNKFYQIKMRSWLGKKRHLKLNDNYIYTRLSNGLTITVLGVALACFWLEGSDLHRLVRTIGYTGLASAFGCSVLLTAIAATFIDGLRWFTAKTRIDQGLAWPWSRQALVALGLLLLVMYAALTKSDAPAFVYATF